MSFMFTPYPYDDTTAVNRPVLPLETVSALAAGRAAVGRALAEAVNALAEKEHGNTLFIALDGYVGADWRQAIMPLEDALSAGGWTFSAFDVVALYKSSEALEAMLAENLPDDREIDPVLLFGKIFTGTIEDLFDAGRLSAQLSAWKAQKSAGAAERRVVCVYGCGAACKPLRGLFGLTAYLDLTPLHVTLRVQAGEVKPLGDCGRRTTAAIFRRLYYFDYEIATRHREELLRSGELTFYIDGNAPGGPKLLPLDAFRTVLTVLARTPFRCKPVYLEGVWGGFFIKKLRGLPEDMRNCAWVFDLIPNEVSVLVKVGRHTLEIPFPTFFRCMAEDLMGAESVRRFGPLFPIRFNYDDTYAGGGNMSVQVHPPAAYAREHFGEPFQQDESYYVVETGGSRTYLGFRDDADTNEFFEKVRLAETKREPFDYEKYVNAFESRKGDQFLLPGGTLHASGWNQVVLEIGSCTVGSYTFKLYDYLRLDLSGIPRPIHSRHGRNVVDTACRRSAADGALRPRSRVAREGEGWREVILGEHEKLFFSLRRLEFERCVRDDTDGRFHVLVLVEGEETLVYALDNPERCYRMKTCDMVVVPAAAGRYGIINLGNVPCKVTKTLLK